MQKERKKMYEEMKCMKMIINAKQKKRNAKERKKKNARENENA